MRKSILLFVLFFTICFSVFSQRNRGNGENGDTEQDDTAIYVINHIEFDGTGRTRESAIKRVADLKTGEELTGFANLERYIGEKRWRLNNERALASSSVEYKIGEQREDGKYPVDLFITTKDTWNIIPLPYPKYDTNSGFELTLKIRDYNFFGTLLPLRVDVGYRRNNDNNSFFHLMTDFTVPFTAKYFNWNLGIYNFFEYDSRLSKPLHSNTSLSGHISLPVGKTHFGFGLRESLIIYQENDDEHKALFGDVQKPYLQTSPSVSWWTPLGLEIGKYGMLGYSTYVSATFNHRLNNPLPPNRIGPWMHFSHSIGFGRVSWVGNFKDGFSMNASNWYNYDFYNKKNNWDPWNYGVSSTVIWHKAFEDIFSISMRGMYRQWFRTTNESAGDVLRGIVNDNLHSNLMFSLNVDLTLGIMKFRPSEWLSNKFRLFDFDMHFVPFIDVALSRSDRDEKRYPDASFAYKNLFVTGGLEVIVYPLRMRSLNLRVSAGFNFSSMAGTGNRELYMGMEFFY